MPLAATTAWLALLSKDCLGMPRDGSRPSVLIWGGSCEWTPLLNQLLTEPGQRASANTLSSSQHGLALRSSPPPVRRTTTCANPLEQRVSSITETMV